MQQDENAATITVIDAEEVETSAAAAMEEGEGEWVDSADAGEETKTPEFPPLNPMEMNAGKREFRKIRVPPHRFASLKQSWNDIYNPIVTHLKLQIRMNPKQKVVELRTSQHTEDIGAIQKAADFLKAFMLGFEIKDAVALLRLEDLFVDTFEIDDVKTLKGDHLSRAIGRVAGKDGKTKFAIENSTRTRIVLADKRIHILGSFANIKIARDAIVRLIKGSPPGKVYAKLRTASARLNERF